MTTILEVPIERAVGLCAACDHAPTCTHARPAATIVLECDDLSPLKIEVSAPVGVDVVPVATPPDRAAIKGLCATCDRLPSCTYPKLEGGVWHCDEFSVEEA